MQRECSMTSRGRMPNRVTLSWRKRHGLLRALQNVPILEVACRMPLCLISFLRMLWYPERRGRRSFYLILPNHKEQEKNKFIILSPGPKIIWLFMALIYNVSKSASACLYQSICSLIKCLQVVSEPTRGEYVKGGSLRYALTLPTSIRLGWNGLPRTNSWAY